MTTDMTNLVDMGTMSDDEILDQIKKETSEHRVFLYMKGTPEMPRCGFSNQVVQILTHLGTDYGARDILVDPRIRQVLSGWSDWPTTPQLFVDGKLVGGCDITTEMYQDGELQELLGVAK
jgi:monothiol glutaredoxin